MLSLPYILETQLCLALFWLIYRLTMRGSGALGHNRAYLLLSVAAALVIPALAIPVWTAEAPAAMIPVEFYYDEAAFMPTTPAPTPFNWPMLAGGIALAGAAVMAAGVCCQAAGMLRSLRRARTVKAERARIVFSGRIRSPYSFFGYIFVDDNDTAQGDLPQILAHEMAHVRLGHSYDALLAQLLLILFWWNPFVWLWNRSLREVHEYQADRAVLREGIDTERYITTLLKTFAGIHPEFVSGFSYSLIKNRLIMMTKQIPGRGAHWRLLAAIPACAAALLIFAFTDKPAEAAEQQAIQLTVTPAPEKEEIQFTFTPPPENKEIQLTVTPETPAAPAADDPMVIVDEPAVFPEAEGSFATWVMRQIRYPQAAQENGTQGRVNLRFVIERDGSVSNIEVMNSPERILSDEAIRVVRSSPKWTPARHKGELVRTWFALPIEFRLDSPAVPTTPVAPPAAPTDKPVAIDDIIAVGYGAIKREGNSMTLSVDPSAIGVITAVREELRSENTKQSESVIYVRNSDPGKEPKFIIDGIEADSETFQKLDPNQIKSITVLKDASSTAIYKGGEHGVVLVETKNSDATIHETNSFTDHYIIIDGKVATEKKFNRLKPEEIESIEVLKGDGSGKNGVLIVKTKR